MVTSGGSGSEAGAPDPLPKPRRLSRRRNSDSASMATCLGPISVNAEYVAGLFMVPQTERLGLGPSFLQLSLKKSQDRGANRSPVENPVDNFCDVDAGHVKDNFRGIIYCSC